jgi:two-component system chemotaxis response regulator CheY
MSKKVVLVDDSRTILVSAEMALEGVIQSGLISLKTYLNPEEFLADALNGSVEFDLLVSDVNMPQMNGLTLAEKLKEDERFKNKPILILTTESSAEMKQRGKSIGVTGWMVKPFSDEKLLKSIKFVLGI